MSQVADLDEQIPFAQLPKVLKKVYGVSVSLATLYRWRLAGRNGVKLPVNLIVGKPHVTLRQIDEFNEQVTRAHVVSVTTPTTDKQAQKAQRASQKATANITECAPAQVADGACINEWVGCLGHHLLLVLQG